MQLVIVESPTKAKTIGKFLGQEYKVFSSYGHVRDLPKSTIGVDLENNFEPKYITMPKARKTITLLKKEVAGSEKILLSTDPDREGEAIAWHLVQALGLNNPKSTSSTKASKGKQKPMVKTYDRITFHEITKKAVEEALANPRQIDMNLVNAQQARRVLDRIVGYKLSPFLWKKVVRGLSAGRVQSVAVRLVVEREREVLKFIAEEYWTIIAKLKTQKPKVKNEFEATLVKIGDKTLEKLEIKTKEEAEKITEDLKGANYIIENVDKKEVKRNPLPPFTTSALQQEAWKKLRFPAKLTMRLAQGLYEKGFITYHRTDSMNLSDLSLFAAKEFIAKNYGENYWAGYLRKYKAKGNVQEAHEAIRPTYPDNEPEKIKAKAEIDNNQLRLYHLIWRRFIACQMAQAIFDSTKVDVSATSKSKAYGLQANGSVLKFDGFLKLYPLRFEETELPDLETNENLELIEVTPAQHFTQPPARFTEATLIKALETNGIGRPSTYAPILGTIQERNYIEKDEKKFFKPTEIGFVVNDILVANFPEVVDIKFTAHLEEDLDKIAEGTEEWIKVMHEFYDPFAKNLEQKYKDVSKKEVFHEQTDKKCPECGAPLIIRLGKYGKFYACSKFPECKYTESLKDNRIGIKCPKCGMGDLVEKRTKRKKVFYGCNQFPKCDFALWDKPIRQAQGEPYGEKCPTCGSLMVQTKRKQIKCSNIGCESNKKPVDG